MRHSQRRAARPGRGDVLGVLALAFKEQCLPEQSLDIQMHQRKSAIEILTM